MNCRNRIVEFRVRVFLYRFIKKIFLGKPFFTYYQTFLLLFVLNNIYNLLALSNLFNSVKQERNNGRKKSGGEKIIR